MVVHTGLVAISGIAGTIGPRMHSNVVRTLSMSAFVRCFVARVSWIIIRISSSSSTFIDGRILSTPTTIITRQRHAHIIVVVGGSRTASLVQWVWVSFHPTVCSQTGGCTITTTTIRHIRGGLDRPLHVIERPWFRRPGHFRRGWDGGYLIASVALGSLPGSQVDGAGNNRTRREAVAWVGERRVSHNVRGGALVAVLVLHWVRHSEALRSDVEGSRSSNEEEEEEREEDAEQKTAVVASGGGGARGCGCARTFARKTVGRPGAGLAELAGRGDRRVVAGSAEFARCRALALALNAVHVGRAIAAAAGCCC